MISQKLVLLLVVLCGVLVVAKKATEKPSWAKKDIRDYSDADMERLLDQWEVSFVIYKPFSCVFNFFLL